MKQSLQNRRIRFGRNFFKNFFSTFAVINWAKTSYSSMHLMPSYVSSYFHAELFVFASTASLFFWWMCQKPENPDELKSSEAPESIETNTRGIEESLPCHSLQFHPPLPTVKDGWCAVPCDPRPPADRWKKHLHASMSMQSSWKGSQTTCWAAAKQ